MTLIEANTLGKRIRYYRLLRGLVTADLARRVGLQRPGLCQIELGINIPDAARVQAIALELHISAGDLYPAGWIPRMRKIPQRLKRQSEPQLQA